MEEFSIAKLEEELGLYGYLHNATSMCNRTAGMFAGSTDGWKNGKRRFFKKTYCSLSSDIYYQVYEDNFVSCKQTL